MVDRDRPRSLFRPARGLGQINRKRAANSGDQVRGGQDAPARQRVLRGDIDLRHAAVSPPARGPGPRIVGPLFDVRSDGSRRDSRPRMRAGRGGRRGRRAPAEREHEGRSVDRSASYLAHGAAAVDRVGSFQNHARTARRRVVPIDWPTPRRSQLARHYRPHLFQGGRALVVLLRLGRRRKRRRRRGDVPGRAAKLGDEFRRGRHSCHARPGRAEIPHQGGYRHVG
jgi:hypothetical protein